MSSGDTLFARDGAIATLTFNRPAARNALTWEMYDGLVEACECVDADSTVRVFVIRGAGEQAFAAGTDIRQFAAFRGGEDGIRYEARIDAVLDRLDRVSVPTIARIQGVAAGGGCLIALTCDMRVCGPNASFAVPIARTLGNCLSATSCARLIALAGPAVAKDLLFTARSVKAIEAQSIGLVSRLVAAEELDKAVQELAIDIAANAPLTVRASKEIVRRLGRRGQPDPELDSDLIRLCYGSEDFQEGIKSFLEKRSPNWKGI